MAAFQLSSGGVNSIQGVEFQVAESRKFKDDARLRAIHAAKEKATVMAELGQTISKPWDITEENDNPIYAYYQNTRVLGGAMEPVPNEPTVAPGQIAIRSSIKVSFQLD